LVLALVAVVAIIALTLLGTQISTVLNDVACQLPPGCS
jgi:Flp pilus assembly pilin Flp